MKYRWHAIFIMYRLIYVQNPYRQWFNLAAQLLPFLCVFHEMHTQWYCGATIKIYVYLYIVILYTQCLNNKTRNIIHELCKLQTNARLNHIEQTQWHGYRFLCPSMEKKRETDLNVYLRGIDLIFMYTVYGKRVAWCLVFIDPTSRRICSLSALNMS